MIIYRSLLVPVLFFLTGAIAVSAQPAASKQPNIIFILTDDHRFDAMGFLGHPFLETPHMDRLSREGVYFANAMVTTSYDRQRLPTRRSTTATSPCG